jgi:hypothetical protein
MKETPNIEHRTSNAEVGTAGGTPGGAQPGSTLQLTDPEAAFRAHPLLPLPPLDEVMRDLENPETREQTMQALIQRAKMIRAAEANPLYCGLRLAESRRLDALLCEYQVLYESGGKRAGKTHDGVARFLRSCLAYGEATRWAMQGNDTSSVENLQRLVWEYLPEDIKALNMKDARKGNVPYRIHYKPDTGFDKLLILPNGCRIYFLNYTQDPLNFQGWKLGKRAETPLIEGVPDIGALLDEDCPMSWFENIKLRCSDLGSKIHWMYSPMEGITPTIKQLKANAKTVESAPAELLADRVNVPGLPAGHMPLLQVDTTQSLAIFYRYTEHNPYSNYAKPGGIKSLCLGRNDPDYTMRNAYGFCEAVRGRVLPLFGEWNIVPKSALPAEGTNYMVTDPAGARNWFTPWARVTPGNPSDIYIYREWPMEQELGEWAKTSNNPKRLNGDRGRGQPTVGYGPEEYVKLFLQKERILIPRVGTSNAEHRTPNSEEEQEAMWDKIAAVEKDPYRRRLLREVLVQFADNPEDMPEFIQEEIYERLIDPRAAGTRAAGERASETLIAKLNNFLIKVINGMTPRPTMGLAFVPAPGLPLADGLSRINEYLYFDRDRERVPVLNAPRLFICEECRNLIWAMNNYSLPNDTESSDDACEDPIDCLRYLVTRGLRYIMPGGKIKTTGGGTY